VCSVRVDQYCKEGSFRIYSWRNALTRTLVVSGVGEKVRARLFSFVAES
jgi:hypothetical protein